MIIACILLLCGCSDSPQEKAAKMLREQMERSLESARRDGTYTEAYSDLNGAIRRAGTAGTSKDAALLAAGSLSVSAAQKELLEFGTYPVRMNDLMRKVDEMLPRAEEQFERRESLAGLYAGGEKEMQDLWAMIEGTAEQPGLRQKLEQYRGQMAELEQQRDALAEEFQALETKLEASFNAGNAKLRQSQQAGLSTSEEVRLQEEGFKILRERKDGLSKLQDLQSRIDLVEQEITLTRPILMQLEQDIKDLRQRIENVEQMREASGLNQQIDDARGQMRQIAADVQAVMQTLGETRQEFEEYIATIDGYYAQAAEAFEQVRSRGLRNQAEMSTAQTHYLAGLLVNRAMDHAMVTAKRLKSQAEMMGEAGGEALSAAAAEFDSLAQGYQEKTREYYETALQNYDALTQSMRGTDEADCAAAKAYLLALTARRDFERNFTPFMFDDATQARIDELLNQAAECDPKFETSTTARLYTGQLDFVPKLELDTATYYDQLQKEFQDRMARLPGLSGDERKAYIEQLLADLEPLKERDAEEYQRAFGAMEQQLQDELARGDEPAETPGGFGAPGGFSPTDPNNRNRF